MCGQVLSQGYEKVRDSKKLAQDMPFSKLKIGSVLVGQLVEDLLELTGGL